MENNSLLDVQHLSHMFHLKRKMTVKAIDDVSFQIKKGEIYGLVGESGSGKSTVARCIMNIYKPSEGEIFYKGIPICKNKEFRKNRKMLQMTRQMIFQDSASSLNPRMKIGDIVAEPLRIYSGKGRPGKKGDRKTVRTCRTGSQLYGKISLRIIRWTAAESSDCTGTLHKTGADRGR